MRFHHPDKANTGPATPRHERGFTLVELLVVIGIIAVMIGMLMPALPRARAQANSVKCMSNLKQVGLALQLYSETWKGYVYPPRLGANRLPHERWMIHVFKMKYPTEPALTRDQDSSPWTPDVMLCPQDPEPMYQHSYVLNDHLATEQIKYSSRNLGGKTPYEVIVLGEKKSDQPDYYMNISKPGEAQADWRSDFDRLVEPFRHGVKLGSNYLHLDWSVSNKNPKDAKNGIDPWQVEREAQNTGEPPSP